jgi:hypothetical protein
MLSYIQDAIKMGHHFFINLLAHEAIHTIVKHYLSPIIGRKI